MKKSYVIVALILYIFLSVSIFLPNFSPPLKEIEVPTSEIRVMTFNLHFGVENDVGYDINNIIDVIQEIKPQIVGFQEITQNMPGNGFANMFGDLQIMMAELGFKNSYITEGGTQLLRNALFSIYEITSVETIDLQPKVIYQRSLIVAEINANGQNLHVLVTHLTHVESGFQETHQLRVDQVTQIVDEINKVNTDKLILMGDFNAEPHYAEIQLITSVLTDAWSYANPGTPGFTSPVTDPDIQLDYIFMSDMLNATSCDIYQTTISDHLPMFCDFTVM